MRLILSLVVASLLSLPALADTRHESPSLAAQMAKRIAAMENGRDLPSRAVWLSQRVVNNNRLLAYNAPKQAKPKKRPVSEKN